MTDNRVYVAQDSIGAAGESTWMAAKASKMGFQVVTDFYTQMAIEQRVFQVKAGTVTTPLVGDVVVTDTKAEMSVDARTGTTVIPVYNNVSLNLAADAALLLECAGKSVPAVTTSGTAFIPLPLYSGGVASTCLAYVAAAGGVVVAAEVATTTRRHWSWSQPIPAGAWNTWYDWTPHAPPILAGPACYYVQIAADDTVAPSYFAHFDYIELPTAAVS